MHEAQRKAMEYFASQFVTATTDASNEESKELETTPSTSTERPADKIGVSAAGTAMITPPSTPIINVNTDLCPFDYIAVLGKLLVLCFPFYQRPPTRAHVSLRSIRVV
jgi:hypothetical protein